MQLGALVSDSANAHLFCENVSFVMNRLLIILLLMHTLTCLGVRQQKSSIIHGQEVHQYIENASFLMATAATVGYGDSTIDHNAEDTNVTYMYGISIIICALVFFSFMQSTFSILFKKLGAAKFTSETELGEIEDWITLRNRMGPMPIPRKFEKVTKGYLRYVSQHDHSILMDSPFHEELPHHVQMKLENVVFHNLLIQFHFLKNLKNDLLAAQIVKDATTEW